MAGGGLVEGQYRYGRTTDSYHGSMTTRSGTVAGLLLAGGSSRRMGRDKSQVVLDGVTLAVRTASLLLSVVEIAVEVGPGTSGLVATLEDTPGEGPLAGIIAGGRALRDTGHQGGAIVVACDMPFLSVALLRYLVEWDATGSVVPVVRGVPQPLCARWSAQDLDGAATYFDRGERSLRHLVTQPDVVLLDESHWRVVASEKVFSDVDTPDDLERLGL